MLGPLKRLFGRAAPTPFIETRLERLASFPPMPPPPPAEAGSPIASDPQPHPGAIEYAGARPVTGPANPQVKLILADGTESTLLSDPELAARADYLVKSMLPPRPPGPDEGSK